MLKIVKDIFVAGDKIGTIEIEFEGEEVKITHDDHYNGKVEKLTLDPETATTLYELMTWYRMSRNH